MPAFNIHAFSDRQPIQVAIQCLVGIDGDRVYEMEIVASGVFVALEGLQRSDLVTFLLRVGQELERDDLETSHG